MSTATRQIAISLVSHTNAGKTTLARTLLGRDVGVVRDEAHVTDRAEAFVLVESPSGDRLTLWDTPGFGDSVRLARRLSQAGNPVGWLLTQVWDRFRDRPFWSSQQAVRNVREEADLVLYLVNASEQPEDAGYIEPEMRILDWIGRPVVVLLNQLGRPRPRSEEAADVDRWRRHLSDAKCVRAVLPLDAFARCWIQETVLFDAIAAALPPDVRPALDRLRAAWQQSRGRVFDDAMSALAGRLARAAFDRETLPEEGLLGHVRDLGALVGIGADKADRPKAAAMQALAGRLDDLLRATTDTLIETHGLSGRAKGEILARLADHYSVQEPVSEGRAALVGGIVTGALAGLKADLATGGMTFGAGLLTGGVLGALGAAGLARGYNLVRGAGATSVRWSDAMLDQILGSSLVAYLAVAHYGRGRGDWVESEHPSHWQQAVADTMTALAPEREHLWSLRDDTDEEAFRAACAALLREASLDVLGRLYPDIDIGSTVVPAD